MSDKLNTTMSSDPYSIKKKLVDLIDKHLGVNNPDTYEAGFLGWLVQAQTTLTSDTLLNLSMSFNESFTHKAVLPSSVADLSAMFDYEPKKAIPASGKILITVPFPIETPSWNFIINHGTICTSESNLSYKVDGTYSVSITDTPNITKTDPNTGSKINIPFNIYIKDDTQVFSFYVDVKQFSIYDYSIKISSPKLYVFYDIPLTGIKDSIYEIFVAVYSEDKDDADNVSSFVRYERVKTLYTAKKDDKVFYLEERSNDSVIIRFGNGVFGEQPKDGSMCRIIIYTTRGSEGNSNPNSITIEENIVDVNSNKNIPYSAINPTSLTNGSNAETLEETKQNIIAQISSTKKLTTQKDYFNFNKILNVGNMKALPQLLRRDGNCNEIDLFSVLEDDNGKPIPTTNINHKTENLEVTNINKNKVYRIAAKKGANGYFLQPSKAPEHYNSDNYKSKYFVDVNPTFDTWKLHQNKIAFWDNDSKLWTYESPEEILEFVCPFNIKMNPFLNRADYEYILTRTERKPSVINQSPINNNITLDVKDLILEFHPKGFYENPSLTPTTISFNTRVSYTSTVNIANVKMSMIFIKSDGTSVNITPTLTANIVENKELIYTVSLPESSIPRDDFKIKTVLYYAGEYYCDYFINLKLYETGVLKTGLNLSPIEYESKTSPAIEKINLGIENIIFEYVESDSPTPPTEGSSFLVGDGATGSWLGQDGKIATYVKDYKWNFTSYKIKSETNVPANNEIYEGVAYIVGPSPTYTPWIGKAGKIAIRRGSIWVFSNDPIYWRGYTPPIITDSASMVDKMFYIKDPAPLHSYIGSNEWYLHNEHVAIYSENGYKWIFRDPQPGDPTIPYIHPPTDTDAGFNVFVKISKIPEMLKENILCKFSINDTTIPEVTAEEINNGQTLQYKYFIPLSNDLVKSGMSTYDIELFYNQKVYNTQTEDYEYEWKKYAVYSDSLYLKNTMSNVCWSNIKNTTKEGYGALAELLKENNPNTYLSGLSSADILLGLDPYGDVYECHMIYKIPVIEKSYYDAYKEYIDDVILYKLTELNNDFLNYRMLTDSMNLKFAKTCGMIENLKYNDIAKEKTDQEIPTYDNFTWDVCPTIKVKLYLKPTLKRGVTEIINECKNLILTFSQITAGFHKPLIKSSILRYIHDVIPEVESCEMLEPTKDIIFFFDPERDLPKNIHEVFSYNPEYIWYDLDKISVETAVLPS